MQYSKLVLISFAVIAAVQWFVPVSMIAERENILSSGKEYKFRTEPVDPYDPFRGKYINLSFAARSVSVNTKEDWQVNETIYVLLATGSDGFVKANSVRKTRPKENVEFVKAKVDYVLNDSELFIEYPFDRFYMEESKAAGAETAYRQSARDNSHETYALVNVKNGEAVLKDVMIDGIPLSRLAGSKN